MFFVECCHATAALQCSGGHDQIIITNQFARTGQLRPDARVFVGGFLGVGNDRERGENRLEIFLPANALRPAGALHAMPEFGDGDGGDFKSFRRLGGEPAWQIKRAFLAPDDDVRVEDYRHLSSAGLRVLRALIKSLRQPSASAGERSTCASASAKSLPVQIFSASGMRRANGLPFLTSTKLRF